MNRAVSVKGWAIAVLLGGLATSATAHADSMNCKNRIVSTGDTRYQVKATCGDPDDASQRVEYRTVRGRVTGPCTRQGDRIVCSDTREQVVEVVIDEWTYDFGKNRFLQHLTFEQGRLVTVRSGGYGYK